MDCEQVSRDKSMEFRARRLCEVARVRSGDLVRREEGAGTGEEEMRKPGYCSAVVRHTLDPAVHQCSSLCFPSDNKDRSASAVATAAPEKDGAPSCDGSTRNLALPPLHFTLVC